MFYINTKQFSIITLLLFSLFVPHISTTSFAQKAEEANSLNLETLLGETTSGGMSGSLKFQYEMAELLGETSAQLTREMFTMRVALQAFIPDQRSSFPEKECTGIFIIFCL